MRPKVALALPVLLALAGVGVSAALLQDYTLVLRGGVSGGLFCGGASGGCDAVAAHPSSEFLTVPVALWGQVGFLLLLVAAVAALLLRGADRRAVLAFGAALSGLALLVDARLAWLMLARIGAVCPNCVATWALNAALLASFLLFLRAEPGRPRWRLLLPSPAELRGGDESDYYRNLLKAGLLALGPALALLALALGLPPVRAIRAWGEEQLADFLHQARTAPPPIDMARFAGRPTSGEASAPVHIVLAGDFQCSHCRSIARTLDELRGERPGRLRTTFVHAPVSSRCNPAVPADVHPEACWLAEAADCARAQGRFWVLHDFLYGAFLRSGAKREAVERELEALGLDRATFAACMASPAPGERVRADVELLAELGVVTTPSLVINGHLKRGDAFPWMLRAMVEGLDP